MSTVNALYHIVICTKWRKMTLNSVYRKDLYRYMWSEIEAMNCRLLRIGGIDNHIHLLVDLSSSISLADFMKRLKQQSSVWAKTKFSLFEGWSREYAAFSCSFSERDRIIEYIKSQEEHHRKKTFEEEIDAIFAAYGFQFNHEWWNK